MDNKNHQRVFRNLRPDKKPQGNFRNLPPINKKGALQISFAWLFAIIVGTFILFLAIFAVTKFIQTDQTTQTAKTGKEIGILLNPLETGFETGTITFMSMPLETRIYNKCNTNGDFGRQVIQVSQKSFNKWTETNLDIGFSNKYIFSEDYAEGKNFYLFSKPFDFPFKITDLIYLIPSTEKYCFIDPPEHIEEELSDLNQPNLLLENCPENSINVCFGSGGDCDISVNQNRESVEKEGGEVEYTTDALMYAAIFSDKRVYECQLERVMQRLGSLALIYREKAVFVAQQGCESEMDAELTLLENSAKSFSDPSDIFQMINVVEDLEYKNNAARCKLW